MHNLCFPPVRGVLQRNYNLLRQVSIHNEVHVVAFDQPASRPSGVSAEDCARALRKFCASVHWIPISDSPLKGKHLLALQGLLSRNPYDVNWMRSPMMAQRIREVLDSIPIEVVHFDTLGLAQYLPLVSNAGSVLNHHNIESSMMEHRASMEPTGLLQKYFRFEARKLRQTEQRYATQVGCNLVVSSDDGYLLRDIAPECKTSVVANGVDTEFFLPREDPGGKSILFCGGLDWYPNSEAMQFFFDEIWPQLVQREPDIRAVIVGRNPPAWLTKLGNNDGRVTVTGFVDDVRPFFREAALYFCPIRAGGGTRLKILDALAMGMPLVGTTFSCSGLRIEGERHVLLADSPTAFVDQVIRALNSESLRLRLAREGRDHVTRNFSWSVVRQQLEITYERLATGRSECTKVKRE